MALANTPGEAVQIMTGYDFISGPVFDVATREERAGLHVATLATTVLEEHGFIPTSLREIDMVVGGDATLLRLMGGSDVLFVPKPRSKMYRRDVADVDTEAIASRSGIDLKALTDLKSELDTYDDPDLSVVRALGSNDNGLSQLTRHHDLAKAIARRAVGFMPFLLKPGRELRTSDPYTAGKVELKRTARTRISLVAGSMSVAEAVDLADEAITRQTARRAYWAQRVADHKTAIERLRASKAPLDDGFPQDKHGQLRLI